MLLQDQRTKYLDLIGLNCPRLSFDSEEESTRTSYADYSRALRQNKCPSQQIITCYGRYQPVICNVQPALAQSSTVAVAKKVIVAMSCEACWRDLQRSCKGHGSRVAKYIYILVCHSVQEDTLPLGTEVVRHCYLAPLSAVPVTVPTTILERVTLDRNDSYSRLE